MKKFLAVALSVLFIVMSLTSCDLAAGNNHDREQEYHALVYETQQMLDEYADDIYSCWYDYVYEREYSSVDSALLTAMLLNSDNISKIKANNELIKEMYSEVKDGDLKYEVKSVMQAYNDYYSFVMEVSGSYSSFSANKETLKKELSSALRDLEFEL